MANNHRFFEKQSLPLITLNGSVFAFPSISITIDISSPEFRNAIEFADKNDSLVYIVSQKNPFNEKTDLDSLYEVGTVARVKQITKRGPKKMLATLESIARAEHISIAKNDKFYVSEVVIPTIVPEDFTAEETEALLRELKSKAKQAVTMFSSPSKDLLIQIDFASDLSFLADLCGALILSKPEDRYQVLKEYLPFKRAIVASALLDDEIKIIRLETALKRKTNKQIEENQREYYLREQLKVIQAELGNDSQSETEELYDKIIAKGFPKEITDKLLKELSRFNKAPFGSPEANVLRTYIDVCLEITFNKYSNDETSVANARKVLEKDHYGLEKVKERILEFIAVKEFKPDVKNQIICLVGPPGVGKTSLCSSIARALKRKYVRVSLGGIRDEADIRGHRKTYIGAMPGRIITALSECKSANPVMVLDEIDKMTSDSRGDPASALLEVLDSEQNKAFRDHFVEMDIDLSRVMFIATANSLDTIPKPLIDRMEIIELSSYTRIEKLHIAKNHLIPKQLKLHGLNKRLLKISDDAIFAIIDSYTAEAGVRNLEREIACLCRHATKEIIESGVKSLSINGNNISKHLGTRKYDAEVIDEENQVGVVNGMAYTSIGGDLLKIEATIMKGNGKLQLTGSLGDVMKESCELAVSFIRANAQRLGIDPDFYTKNDIHIHVPEGAVPKDGPSAGVTITTALVSALTGKRVRRDVAMTGEITLRGKVLPIGGLKEKTLSADSAGVKTIVVPKANEKNLNDLEPIVRENVHFVPCSNIFEVLEVALIEEEYVAIINNVKELIKNENKC